MSYDKRNPLYGISLKSGMKKDEVNKLLGIIELLNDEYKGKRFLHNWKCKCGETFEKRWENMNNSPNSHLCKKCQKEENKKQRKINKQLQPHKHNKDWEIVFCEQCGRIKLRCQTTRGLCEKHYGQFLKYGYCLDNNPRTRLDKNEIITYEDYAEIVLYDGNQNEIARTLIDLEDIDKLKDYKWAVQKGYATTKSIGKTLSLHRLIFDLDDTVAVDHINHNTLDNRKSNLRIVSLSENGMNKNIQSNNISGITGVYFNEKSNLWYAQIKKDGITIPIGSSKDYVEAIEMRLKAEEELFGEYSLNNSIDIFKIKPTINTIYKVDNDMRINYGIVECIVNKYIVKMHPIKNNTILFDECLNVDIRRLKYIEIV